MARRRRLTPARAGWLGDQGAAGRPMRGPDLGPDPAAPPIAQVAAEASAASALAEVAAAMAAARAEGRLVQRLALDAIAADHLLRDRIGIDEAALEGLIASIAAHGQRSPIEVAEIGPGRYGLISGWRRLTALARLQARSGEALGVLALVRQPRDAAEAYVAMVEENEIRLDLSHYERARIVARSVAAGVFPDTQTALRRLFAQGSRARRSKIGAFLTLVQALDGVLRHPAQMGERLGLQLAQRLAAEPGLADRLRAALSLPVADAAAEQAVIAAVLGKPPAQTPDQTPAQTPAAPPAPPRPQTLREEPRPGVQLETSGWLHPVLTLSGPGVDQSFKERLIAWLQGSG